MRRLVLLTAALALLGSAPAAEAISRADARQAVKKALKRPLKQNAARLHVLTKRVPRGAIVGQGGRPAQLEKVKRKAWLFWLDQAPGAGFQHPSILVLVDNRTGRVVRREGLSWWPVLNGKRLFATAVGKRPRPARAAALAGFRNDCIVTIGDRTDSHFVRGLAAMTALGLRHGAKVASARTRSELASKIDELAAGNPRCVDVVIYIAAHGWAPRGTNMKLDGGGEVAESDKAQVTLKSTVAGGKVQQETLDVDQVRRIMRDRPRLTFKLVVESCFSGRWTTAMAEPNLRITLTSSRASELTFLNVTDPRRGRQSGGKLELTGSEQGDPDPADAPPPFTAGVTQAIDEWASSDAERAKGEELGEALGYAGTHRDGDRARSLGWQSGRTDDRTDQRPHAPPPTTNTAFSVSINGSYRHIGPGNSEACFAVQTSPPRPEALVEMTVSGPGVVAQPQTTTTDASGFVRIRVRINSYGSYQANAQVTAADGTKANGTGTVVVSEAQGTCPP